ncbi:speckle-type POZ protein-like [Leptopilina heterotoma]|uniref:speckle-type POZ protein-like n=1 Tax=Leptopilina heterotoma TaxID=63436 RepID=UPI001CA9E135|nr:speckle-type POZ protein-like [Leptopilina heterotoma]
MTEIKHQKNDEIIMNSETGLKKITAKLKWTIKDFQTLTSSENRRRFPNIQSSTFFIQDKDREKPFQITFHYNYNFLHFKCTPDLPKYSTIVCSVLNKRGMSDWQSSLFIPPLNRIQLTPEFLVQLKKPYKPYLNLVLLFQIDIIDDVVTNLVYDSTPSPVYSNFDQFRQSQTICDVTFFIDNRELKAHKVILASRSPVFLAMFQHQFAEQNNNVTIVDIRFEIFEALLQYIYNCEIKDLNDIADELLIAADKYLIDELKFMCEKVLTSNMSKEKAANLLSIAAQCKCENLEACCRFHILGK